MAMTTSQDTSIAQWRACDDTGRRERDPDTGYHTFFAGGFELRRDEYFARISWPGGTHVMPIDAFLRALMGDVAWGFFYGVVNFDSVFGTINHYGEVTVFAGRFNDGFRKQHCDHEQRFRSGALMEIFKEYWRIGPIRATTPLPRPRKPGRPGDARTAAISRLLSAIALPQNAW
jgi:hypothetical protein